MRKCVTMIHREVSLEECNLDCMGKASLINTIPSDTVILAMGLRVICMNTAYIIVNVFVLSVRGHGLENNSAFPETENFKITEVQFMIAVNATWQGEQCVYIFIYIPKLI